MIISKSYYINLKNRVDRNLSFIEQIKKSKYLKDITRYEAIDGKSLNIKDLDKILSIKAYNSLVSNSVDKLGYDLTYGALGCALSHINIYKECVNNDYESVLIFEDDTKIEESFDEVMSECFKLDSKSFDLLYLNCAKSHTPKLTDFGNSHFDRVLSNLYGTRCYIVTKAGASKLLDFILPLNVQIDSEILNYIKNQQLIALISRKKAVLSCKFKSDVQGKHGLKA